MTPSPASSKPDPNPSSSAENVATIDMKNRTDSEILTQLMEMTQARGYEATAEEQAEMKVLADFQVQAQKDRLATEVKNRRREQEGMLIEQARMGSGAAAAAV